MAPGHHAGHHHHGHAAPAPDRAARTTGWTSLVSLWHLKQPQPSPLSRCPIPEASVRRRCLQASPSPAFVPGQTSDCLGYHCFEFLLFCAGAIVDRLGCLLQPDQLRSLNRLVGGNCSVGSFQVQVGRMEPGDMRRERLHVCLSAPLVRFSHSPLAIHLKACQYLSPLPRIIRKLRGRHDRDFIESDSTGHVRPQLSPPIGLAQHRLVNLCPTLPKPRHMIAASADTRYGQRHHRTGNRRDRRSGQGQFPRGQVMHGAIVP